jgi:hypothetical protein
MQDQAHINKALFELVVSLISRVNELTYRVEALRALQEVAPGGVPPDEFEKVADAVKQRLGPEANETLALVQKLVDELKLPKQ